MNHQNQIQSLYRTDAATASRLMEQYPPQWNMEKVFQKTYQRYLAETKESMQGAVITDSECMEITECRTQTGTAGRFRRAGGYAVFAAAYIGVFLFILKMGDMPPTEDLPDTTNESETTFTQTEPDEGTTTAVHSTESGTTATTAVSAETTTATSVSESSAETTSTAEPTAETTAAPPPESQAVTEVTSAVTIPLTETTSETTAPPETETTPETTMPVQITEPNGQFVIDDPTASAPYYTIRYARESSRAVEEHDHSFGAEGFTLTRKVDYNAEYEFRSTYYSFTDEKGQQYAVNQFQYDYFSFNYNPDSGELMKQYTLGGKSVILIYQEDPAALCRLIWDDGCHVCVMYSEYRDLAAMELLMQSQTGEKIAVSEFESYFKMEEPTTAGGSGQIVFVRGSNDPVEEHGHSFAAEGFTLTDVREYNADQPYRSVHYSFVDETGQQYLVMQEQYEYFAASYDPDVVPLTKNYTIAGKTALLVYEDNLDSICRLIWDDGCHICTMISQYKDLAKMELLAESQITE